MFSFVNKCSYNYEIARQVNGPLPLWKKEVDVKRGRYCEVLVIYCDTCTLLVHDLQCCRTPGPRTYKGASGLIGKHLTLAKKKLFIQNIFLCVLFLR